MASSKKSNYKGRSPNVVRCIESCGSEVDISSLIAPNLAAGARLAAENQSQALDEKTARTYTSCGSSPWKILPWPTEMMRFFLAPTNDHF